MVRNLLFRLLDAIPTAFLILTLVFVAMRILPGDPALAALGEMATAEQLDVYRERFGLNVPVWRQYINFMWGVVTLDLGRSFVANEPVTTMIAQNLPYTIKLTIVAMIIGSTIGIPLGVFAATRRNKLPDNCMRAYSMIGYAIPDFYLGALLLIVFALHLRWFPISGAGGSDFASQLHALILPAISLSFIKSAFLARLTRASVLEVLNRDFIRTARAKGATESRVIFRHGLRNAMLPISTALGLSTLATLSGSVAVEKVFNRPGVGRMLVDAIADRDYTVIQGGILVFALFVMLVNLIMDIVYVIIDPRIRVT